MRLSKIGLKSPHHLTRKNIVFTKSSESSDSRQAQINTDSITFVCCVEAGSLETYTVRMIESLRRWGGRFKDAPLIAVTPRFGPPLTRKTLEVFKRCNVKYIRCQPKIPYIWFKFINKPLALLAAESYATTDAISWLDSDLLILDEPEALLLQNGEDFLGCASDKEMGTSGVGDTYESLWQANCRTIGLDVEALPWIVTEQEKERIRLYWNGGIFVYRRSTGFAQAYLDTCLQLMDARITTKVDFDHIGINEQSAIGLTMVKLGLSWRALPYSHDYIMSSLTHANWYDPAALKAAKITHYHDSMWSWFWDEFTGCLQQTHPQVAEWLMPYGPMQNPAPFMSRLLIKFLKSWRRRKELAYLKTCTRV